MLQLLIRRLHDLTVGEGTARRGAPCWPCCCHVVIVCCHVCVMLSNSLFEAVDPALIGEVLTEALKDLNADEAFQVFVHAC